MTIETSNKELARRLLTNETFAHIRDKSDAGEILKLTPAQAQAVLDYSDSQTIDLHEALKQIKQLRAELATVKYELARVVYPEPAE